MRNDEFIRELLNAKEGEPYQFKEAKNRFDFEEAVKICCALSNCGGGRFVLGISDKRPRKVVGSQAFEQPERTRKGLIDRLHIGVDFQLFETDKGNVLVFEVAAHPIGLPVQDKGIVWWYEGDSHIPMPQNLLRDIYAEAGHDYSADICPEVTITDLDDKAIEIFREKWAAKSANNRINTLSAEQLLRDSGAVTSKGVTYAALVLFGKSETLRDYLPQAEIVFEYRSSEASGPAAQRENLRVGFFACFDRIWELINLRNDRQHYQDGLFVFDVPTFNERVVREALLNAVSHRNYQLAGSVFVRQYRDRLVIDSPGGFPNGIRLDNILDRQSPRNRRIAEIFALCGLVERSGQGMNLIYELSIKEAKSLPDFTGTDSDLVRLTLNGIIIDSRMFALLNSIGNERLESFSTDDFLVINSLLLGEKLTANLRLRTNRLVDIGVVEHIGRNKFVLARSFYDIIGKAGVHTRIVGLDREQNKQLVLKHIRESGSKGAPLKEIMQVLPSHSRKQVQALVSKLRDEGKIRVEGKTNAAKWFFV
jgi:ATP-dependent DNA helicase RecG